MFKVFIPAKVLANIYLEESSRKNSRNQSNWFRILMKQNTIYTIGYKLPDSVPSDDDASDEAVLWDFCQRYDIAIVPRDNYLQSIKDIPQAVLEQPCGVFYLDITPKEAHDIQNKYGVICQSTSKKFDAKILSGETASYDVAKNNSAPQWSAIYEILSEVPSNALCLIDRNLFVYDGQINPKSGKEQSSGLFNVFFAMDSALPKYSAAPYHITVVFESMALVDKDKKVLLEARERFELLSQSLFQLVKELKRDYPIVVEAIAFNKSTPFYNDLTHNRQIISNYYRITAEQGLNVVNFNNPKKTGTYNQQINVQLLYSSGLRLANANSPVDSNERIENGFVDFIHQWRQDPQTKDYLYATNIIGGSFENQSNRLFMK